MLTNRTSFYKSGSIDDEMDVKNNTSWFTVALEPDFGNLVALSGVIIVINV